MGLEPPEVGRRQGQKDLINTIINSEMSMLIFAGWPSPGCSGPAETSTESGWSQATLQKVVPREESLSLIALVVCDSPALPQKG